MGYKFIGEGSPELMAWPESERRRIFLQAVRRSYCRMQTWAGFILFLVITIYARPLAEFIYSFVNIKLGKFIEGPKDLADILGMCAIIMLGLVQVYVIRKELRKMEAPQQSGGG